MLFKILDEDPGNIAVVDKTGEIQFINGTAQKVMQKNMSGAIPKNFQKCISQRDRNKFLTYVTNSFKTTQTQKFDINL